MAKRMTKKVAAIAVFVIVASLSVAGCIINLTPTPTPIPTPVPTTTRNPILEGVVSDLISTDPTGWVHYGKKVTWNGGNSVTIIYNERGAVKENLNATPLAANHTFMVFANTQDATKYIDSLDKSHYRWSDRSYQEDANGTLTAISARGVPSVYQNWYYIEHTPIEKFGDIYQWDNIVEVYSVYALS